MTAGYYGMVAQLDHAIGRVLDVLDERGLADDTLVIVTSDHGEFLGEHQLIFKGPFGYDSLLRVPLLVRGPGVDAGAVVDRSGRHDRSRADDPRRRPGSTFRRGWKGSSLADRPREYVLTENDFNIVASIPMRTITTERLQAAPLSRGAVRRALRPARRSRARSSTATTIPRTRRPRSDLLALLDDVMNHDVRREPTVGLVA